MIRLLSLLLFLFNVAPVVASEGPAWPDTELSRHARAWFEQLTGSEEEARAFFPAHMAPAALEEAGVDVRLERRRAMLERMGPLIVQEILESTPARLVVRARNPRGEDAQVTLTGEADPPHRLLSVGIQIGGPEGGPPPPSGPPLSDEAAVSALEAHLAAEDAAGRFSGVVLLARDGKPLLRRAFGVANRATGAAVTPGTRFNIASLGKILTKIAMAQLADAGRLRLEDPLSRFLPDFPNADRITLDMLVHHRSGVGDIFNDRYQAMDRSKLRHNRDYLDLFRDRPLEFEPGTGERYSNGGYVLLGEVIARASGMDYYAYLEEKILKPAGMTRTAALLEGGDTPDVARGYTTEGAGPGEERDNVATRPWRGSAAGGSYSTVDDLLALDQALLENRLCPARWSAWVADGPPPFGFGFGGGAPGICSEWTHEGAITLLVLANRDPQSIRPILRPALDIVQRMTR